MSHADSLIEDYLREQHAVILAADDALRRNEADVHAARVAIRRYRSTVRVYRTMLDRPRAKALDLELRWYARLLGDLRDCEVLSHHLRRATASLVAPGAGAARAAIRRRLGTDSRRARAAIARAMRGERYLALIAELRAWDDDVPFAPSSAGEAGEELAGAVTHARRALRTRIGAASNDVEWHSARKSAKRLRYAAELAEPAVGKPARRAVAFAKRLQTELGDKQDHVVAAAFLASVAIDAPPEAAFALGVLYERESAAVDG